MVHPQPALDPASQQWGRWLTDDHDALRLEVSRGNLNNSNLLTQLNSSITNLNAQLLATNSRVDSLPVSNNVSGSATNFAVTGSYVTYATATFTVPLNKPNASIFVIAQASILDTTSGGTTTSYGRIVFNGTNGRDFPAAKDAGASIVNNIITASAGYKVVLVPGATYTMSFQLYGLNGSAFPARTSNFATINASLTFEV